MKIARFNAKGQVEEITVGPDGKMKTVVLGLARMCQVAKNRLGDKDILMFLYINNEQAPVPLALREVIKSYVEGKTTQAETMRKLDELAATEAVS